MYIMFKGRTRTHMYTHTHAHTRTHTLKYIIILCRRKPIPDDLNLHNLTYIQLMCVVNMRYYHRVYC